MAAVSPLQYNLTGPVGTSTSTQGATLYQGSLYTFTTTYAADLTGYGGHMTLVAPIAGQAAPLVVLTLGSGIAIAPGALSSQITITITATQLAGLPVTFALQTNPTSAVSILQAYGYYDLILDPANAVGPTSIVALYGVWSMLPEATTFSGPVTTPVAGVHSITDANFVVTEIVGLIYIGFNGLTLNRTCTLPASPTTGQRIIIADEDGSLGAHTFTLNGNGKNIVYQNVAAGSLVLASGAPGPGGSITLLYNGSFWKAI